MMKNTWKPALFAATFFVTHAIASASAQATENPIAPVAQSSMINVASVIQAMMGPTSAALARFQESKSHATPKIPTLDLTQFSPEFRRPAGEWPWAPGVSIRGEAEVSRASMNAQNLPTDLPIDFPMEFMGPPQIKPLPDGVYGPAQFIY